MKRKPKTQANTPAVENTNDNDTVKKLVKWFDAAWQYTKQNYHSRWENSYRIYNNQRVNRGYEGVSDVIVPMAFSTIETETSALAAGKPSFDFLPPQDKQDQETDILNSLLDYFWDKDQWTPKIESFIRDCLVYGTGISYLYWSDDHPVLLNIPVRDFFVSTTATGIENTPTDFYAGRRYLTTLEELKTFEVVDLSKIDANGNPIGELKSRFKNLDQVRPSGGHAGFQTDKEIKDMFYGSTVSDPSKDQIEVIEFWTEDKKYSLANRTVVIEEEENPYKTQAYRRLLAQGETERNAKAKAKGIIPFIIQRDYADPSLFYGRGEVETIASLQEWLNDHTNQMSDFMSFVLNPAMIADPALRDLIESGQIQIAPGVVIPARPDQVQPVTMPNMPSQAFMMAQNIKNEIRETTAASEVVKGVSSDQHVTATEINAQVSQAGQRLKMKAVRLENEAFHRLARIVFKMVQLYITKPMLVRVVTDRVNWQNFDPAEFQGNYEPRVQLESNVEAKRQADMASAERLYTTLAADPQINQEELKRITLPKLFDLDVREIDRLLTPPKPPMATDISQQTEDFALPSDQTAVGAQGGAMGMPAAGAPQ